VPSVLPSSTTISSILQYEYLYKRITLYKNSKVNFKTFIEKCASRYRISKDYIFIPISEISKNKKELLVYNLEIEDEHTYTAAGISVHNCGGGWLEKKLTNFEIYGYFL